MFDRKATERVLGKDVVPKKQEYLDAKSIQQLAGPFCQFMNGESLVEIERACPNARPKPGFCQRARILTQRISLDVSFLVGLFPQVYREAKRSIDREETPLPTVLEIDCLATDFFHGRAWPTFLYYNPADDDVTVPVRLRGASVDLYDAVRGEFVARAAAGTVAVRLPADGPVLLVHVPAGAALSRAGGRLLADGIPIDFAAAGDAPNPGRP